MLVSHFMVTYSFVFGKFKGSSIVLPAHGGGGARATIKMLVPQKNFRAKPKQAGKKEGGWGEGIFARSCLPFPFRLRKEKAEGGFGGNSAFSLRNQIVDSPAVLLVQSRTPHKSFLFLLEEKNRRAQIKNCEENFSVVWRACRAVAGLASLVGVLLKACSNFVQKTPPSCTFGKIERCCLGASRLGMVFPRENPSIFEGKRKRPLGNAEVRRAKHGSRKAGQPIFLFSAFSGKYSDIFFDCLKANLNTIWTT